MVVEVILVCRFFWNLFNAVLSLVLLVETTHRRFRTFCTVLRIHGNGIDYVLYFDWFDWFLRLSLVCEEDLWRY